MKAAAATPAVEVAVDGDALGPGVLAHLVSVRVARRLSLPAQCEVAFRLGADGAGAAASRLPIGATLAVAVAGDRGPLFEGDVTAQQWVHGADGVAELRVRAYDRLHRLRKRHRVVARRAVSVADLAGELAAEANLAMEADDEGPRWPVLVQHRQCDLQLLQEVAGQAGLWFTVEDGTLRLLTLEGFGEAIDLQLGDTLLAARFDATADPACRRVGARGWDPVGAASLAGEVSTARVGRQVAVEVGPDSVGADGERFLVDRPGPTPDHLVAVAQGELDRRVAREVTLTGTAEGDARLRPGCRVRVAGGHPEVVGTYVLTEATHTVDGRGYLVELSSAPPPAVGPAPAAGATLGRVVSADDPEGRGRVRVALPGYGDVDTDWRPVVVPGAGPGKGALALPDVDDAVLVLLPGGDPAAAIVLGGLYGELSPPDAGVAGGAVRRWSLHTPGGQRVILDDDGARVVVANRAGSAVVLGPETVTVHARGDLVFEAPGRTLTLRAQRIEMVQASEPGEPPVPPGPGVG